MDRKYYAERNGARIEPIDFNTLKFTFLSIFDELTKEMYFTEATGYYCVDEDFVFGKWGRNPSAFISRYLKLKDIWPIPEKINTYDEFKLFSIIEFLFDHVSKPTYTWYHDFNNCGLHANEFNKELGRLEYRKRINELLKDYRNGYELSESGEIFEIPPTGLEPVVNELQRTDDPKNIDNRIQSAIKKYRKIGATTDDKKDAIITLGGVLEFLRNEGIKLPNKDDDTLFQILNCFDIRHHNRKQQRNYDKEIWYDWMFFTFLASINTLLKIRKKYKKTN